MPTSEYHATPRRVLVTGAAGYIGSILCEHLLDEGHTVVALDTMLSGGGHLFHLCANERFEFHYGDCRDERVVKPLLESCDVLVPLAAVVGAPACDRDPRLAWSLNLEAIEMLNGLRRDDQLMIYPTTNSGYGTKSGDVFCTEETPLEPISLYGETKVQAERVVLSRSNSVALRLATVFGTSPRMRLDLLVNHFVYAAMTDRYLVLFEKDFKRNFVHVRDVADCFLHVIRNRESMIGRSYNVGLDAANISKEELALKVKDQVPGFYIHFAPIGSDPDKRNYIVSNDRLRQAGFEARRSLEGGITELIKGYRQLGRSSLRNV